MVEVEIHDQHQSVGMVDKAKECKFHHPFDKPYKVQMQLMEQIYDTIDGDYKIGLFESPTGTGKTLSLICSTMTWLREFKKMKHDAELKKKLDSGNQTDDDDDDDEPDWVKKVYREKIVGRALNDAKRYEKHLEELEKEGPKMITGSLQSDSAFKGSSRIKSHRVKRMKVRSTKSGDSDSDDDIFAPEDYFDDTTTSSQSASTFDKMDSEVKRLLEKVEKVPQSMVGHSKETVTDANKSPIKIYFASRTHSQLSQLCSQLRMTDFPSSLGDVHEKIKYLPLGSRKQLCINESVNTLKDAQQINEKCIDLQKKNSKKNAGCPYLLKMNQPQDIEMAEQFRDMSYSSVQDIEDLDSLGRDLKACPYYNSRFDIPVAELVSLPYNLLLQKDARTSLGIDVKGSIVVIDEAHNLIDTIDSINSSSVSFGELKMVRKALKIYTRKFYSRMNAGNRINLAKLYKLVTILARFIAKQVDLNRAKPGTEIDVNQIFAGTTGDLLNVYPLESYINKSKIAFKLQSYMDKITQQKRASTPLLFKVRSFMSSLSNTSQSGKFFFDTNGQGINETSIKYLLLDPSEPFRDIVEDARCVIMAGGTMEPTTDFTDFLVPYLSPNQINKFSCGHIISDNNLDVYPILYSKGVNFEFNYQNRGNKSLLSMLGQAIIKIAQHVPAGVVIFFPSYHLLNDIFREWKIHGVLRSISKYKKPFTEVRGGNIDKTWNEYQSEIQEKKHGAILFSVVGGKMSEGINFSGDLARAVVMVGLPYPNIRSGDLIAKSRYIEKKAIEKGQTPQLAKKRAQELYKNICMKAVNQSVGRAIRNIEDYAVIYLIDSRYSRPDIQQGLSGWIRKRLVRECGELDNAIKRTDSFFRGHA